MHWKQLANYDYLGAYSLDGMTELTVTIKSVTQELVTGNAGRKENCIVAHFSDNAKPMILNRTNCKTIQKIYSTPNIEEWVGKKIILFVSTASLAGETVECLRIRPYPPVTAKPDLTCTDCGCVIKIANKMSPESIAQYTVKKYGKQLCADCAGQLKAAAEQTVPNEPSEQEILDKALQEIEAMNE